LSCFKRDGPYFIPERVYANHVAATLQLNNVTKEGGTEDAGHGYFIDTTPLARLNAEWFGTSPLSDTDYSALPGLKAYCPGLWQAHIVRWLPF